MNEERLVIGLPAGSLADPGRGGSLVELLKHAGFPTTGYDVGGPSAFPITGVLVGWDGRPQEFGAQLALNELDLAIGGDDWIRERTLELKYEYGQTVELKRVLSLGRGRVRVVIIGTREAAAKSCDAWLADLLRAKPLVTMVSEMPYLALEWFQAKTKALGLKSHQAFSVQRYKTPPRIPAGLVIYETWGKTEAKVLHGSVDFGLELTQSGSAIRNYGLHVLDEVMESQAGVWTSPDIRKNAAKCDLARMFVLNLYGAVFAENKVLVFFNARKQAVPTLLDYLRDNNLFGDEPTINDGVNFTEFSVQLDAASTTLPLAQARYELAKRGATAIETIPLESSIPGLHVLEI